MCEIKINPYEGYIEKLKEPIELKGRVIKYKPVAKLSGKSGAKKGGMRGGGSEWINKLKDVSDIEKEYMKEYEYATHAGQPTHNLGLNPKYINILEDKKLFLRNLVNDHWGWKNNV